MLTCSNGVPFLKALVTKVRRNLCGYASTPTDLPYSLISRSTPLCPERLCGILDVTINAILSSVLMS